MERWRGHTGWEVMGRCCHEAFGLELKMRNGLKGYMKGMYAGLSTSTATQTALGF